MPGGQGYRARTRDTFSRGYRAHGTIPLSVYLRTYKVGDYVDIKVNGAVQKGMPHKYYHGKTGRVWNVTKRAVGIELLKQVNGRYLKKRITIRIEHVQPSRCREDFKARVKANQAAHIAAKAAGTKAVVKRWPAQPRAEGFIIPNAETQTITAIPYDILKEGVL